MTRRRWIVGIVALGTLGLGGSALADSGATVSPPFQNIVMTKDQAGVSFAYSVTNNDKTQAKTFNISTSDFGSLDESGGVAFLGTTPGQIRPHGLVDWLSLGATTLSLAPGETRTIQATIQNQSSLAPGGHYGAILLTPQSSGSADTSRQVIVQGVLSTLLFVEKLGGEQYDLKLSNLKLDAKWWQSPSVDLRFYNGGNIDVTPRGVIQLLDPLGREVARAAINEDSSRVLPQTYRHFTLPLMTTRAISVAGKYQLVAQYRYDGQTNFSLFKSSHYYIPSGTIVLFFGVVGALMAIIGSGVWVYQKRFKRPN